MNWTKASAVAEILSAIAIVVTLAYLAIQTQQNTAAMQANTRLAQMEASQSLLLYVSSNPEIDEFYYKPELTDNEKRRLSTFLLAFVRARETDWLQFQSGGMDERTWLAVRGSMLGTFSTPRTRTWWNNMIVSSAWFDREFVSELDEIIQGVQLGSNPAHLSAFD